MATKRQTQRRKDPPIELGKGATAAEILAAYKITPQEMRRVDRVVALVLQREAAKKAAKKASRSRAAAK